MHTRTTSIPCVGYWKCQKLSKKSFTLKGAESTPGTSKMLRGNSDNKIQQMINIEGEDIPDTMILATKNRNVA